MYYNIWFVIDLEEILIIAHLYCVLTIDKPFGWILNEHWGIFMDSIIWLIIYCLNILIFQKL